MAQMRRNRTISFIIMIALFLTGIYLDIMAEEAFFLCDSTGETFLCPVPFHTGINDAKACETHMLGECSSMEQQSAELSLVFSLLHADHVILTLGKPPRHSGMMQPLCRTLDVLVTDYMHQSDGKKRT